MCRLGSGCSGCTALGPLCTAELVGWALEGPFQFFRKLLAKDGVQEKLRKSRPFLFGPALVCYDEQAAARERSRINAWRAAIKNEGASNPLPPAVA